MLFTIVVFRRKHTTVYLNFKSFEASAFFLRKSDRRKDKQSGSQIDILLLDPNKIYTRPNGKTCALKDIYICVCVCVCIKIFASIQKLYAEIHKGKYIV